jgi:O-acetyl-ADP-ribose deacetylase (regulator of RNase III)
VRIEIEQGSILEQEVDAIVNAANSLGEMGGGVAGAIRRAGGEEIEIEATAKAPIAVGEAVVTGAGRLPFRGVVHAPTMERPAMRIPARNVRAATAAALRASAAAGFKSLAIPGLGTGVGGVAVADAAREMVAAIRASAPRSLERLVLVDVDPAMVAAWRAAMGPKPAPKPTLPPAAA